MVFGVPEFLLKFGETGFARSRGLPDPLFAIDRLGSNKKG